MSFALSAFHPLALISCLSSFETWPSSMAISPSNLPAVSPPSVLQEWLKKHYAQILALKSAPQSAETEAINNQSFDMLRKILVDKNIVSIRHSA